MSLYIKNGKQISGDDFYHSVYNDIFISAYNNNPGNLQKAIGEIKSKGCLQVEACLVLIFVLSISLQEASMIIQKVWQTE